MGCVFKNSRLTILAFVFIFGNLSFAKLTKNASEENGVRKPDKFLNSTLEFLSGSKDDPLEGDAIQAVFNSTLNEPSGEAYFDGHSTLDNSNASFLDFPGLNDSVIEEFLNGLESQQVSVVADTELNPQETGDSSYEHKKGNKKAYHKGKSHTGEKGHVDETGHKGIHTEKHGDSHKAGHHKEAGTKYKGKEHKHQHVLEKADGSKGQKGHHHHSKGHHNKGNKAKGHKNIWHKEESGRSKKFFDDYEHKKYHSKYDDLDIQHKSLDNSGVKGGLIKAKKHHDSFGKKASLDKGTHHDVKKKEEKTYGHKGHFDEHSEFGKKGAHKTAHADGHGGHAGGHGGHAGHGHHGSHSIQKPVATKLMKDDEVNYLGSHSIVSPIKDNALNKFGYKNNIVPISLFVRQDDYEKSKKPSSKVQHGKYGGYLKDSSFKEENNWVSDPEINEISETKKSNSKFQPKKAKKVKITVSKPIINNRPFITPSLSSDNEVTNGSEEERHDEKPSASNSFINIPILQPERTQQISVITTAELNPAESGKGYAKSVGHKKAHTKVSSEKGEIGGKKLTGFKGHLDGDHHEKHHSNFVDKGAKDFHSDDLKKKFDGAHHSGKKGSKGHSVGSKGHHHKGHNDKGFKNVHHKVEYTVKKDFYHDNEDKLKHSSIDDFDTYFNKKRKQNLNDHEFYGKHLDDHYGYKGHHDKGQRHNLHKGHEKHYGHKGHHDHHHSDGNKAHHKKGHGHHHHHDHPGQHSHVSYDYIHF